MPFPFSLPTTSPVSFSEHYSSPVYPSVPLVLTQHRGSLRNRLKSHKRLSAGDRNTDLPDVLKSIKAYLPYLLFAQQSIHSGDVLPSEISKPMRASWRSTLTSSKLPSQEAKRVERDGLEYEIAFALSTLGYTHTLVARKEFSEAMAANLQDTQKQALLNSAIKHLLASHGVFTYSASLSRAPAEVPWPTDLAPAVLSALAALSLADASLLAVSKQDPYPTFLAVSSLRTKDTEYLYAPPDPPKPAKALLFARICIAVASHAERALGLLAAVRGGDLAPELPKYLENLRKVGRAKACRFLGIEAEGSGRIGEGIGWLALARETLGKPKKEKDAGADAGRTEESRVLEELEKIWKKTNDSVYFQLIVASGVLAAKIPSGREVHNLGPWEPERLGADVVRSLRGRVAEEDAGELDEEDSEDEGRTTVSGGFGSASGYY